MQEVRLVDEIGAEEGGVDQAERNRKAVAAQQHWVAQAREAREHQRVSVKRPDRGDPLRLASKAATFTACDMASSSILLGELNWLS